MAKHRIFSVSVASVYPHYIAKAQKKGRTKAEVDEMKTDKPSAASRDTVRGEASPRTSAGERPEQPEAASQATSERDHAGGDYARDQQAPQYPESQQRDTTEYEAPAASASGDPQAPHHRQ